MSIGEGGDPGRRCCSCGSLNSWMDRSELQGYLLAKEAMEAGGAVPAVLRAAHCPPRRDIFQSRALFFFWASIEASIETWTTILLRCGDSAGALQQFVFCESEGPLCVRPPFGCVLVVSLVEWGSSFWFCLFCPFGCLSDTRSAEERFSLGGWVMWSGLSGKRRCFRSGKQEVGGSMLNTFDRPAIYF